MKKTLTAMMIGLGIGSFSYLAALLSVGQTSPKLILSVWLMSALIGATTRIYELKALTEMTRLLLHVAITTILLATTLAYNAIFNWPSLLINVIIYLVVVALIKAKEAYHEKHA